MDQLVEFAINWLIRSTLKLSLRRCVVVLLLILLIQMFSLEYVKWKRRYIKSTTYTDAKGRSYFPNVLPTNLKYCFSYQQVVRMCCNLFHGNPKTTCGTMTTGGSDSLFLACKSYAFYARKERGITRPNIVMPVYR